MEKLDKILVDWYNFIETKNDCINCIIVLNLYDRLT